MFPSTIMFTRQAPSPFSRMVCAAVRHRLNASSGNFCYLYMGVSYADGSRCSMLHRETGSLISSSPRSGWA